MNKKRLLKMQSNIKVRTTIAWQKAQHQKYSSTTIAYWKTHCFCLPHIRCTLIKFWKFAVEFCPCFFCTKWWWWCPFLPSFSQFLSREPHEFALGLLLQHRDPQRPTFLSTTFDSRCSTWSHTSCNWYFHHDKIEEASIITVEDGSIGKWRW